MRRTAFTRILAVTAAALFLGGVGGASDIDALLFHGPGSPGGAAAAHFESAGSSHHADHCLLTFRVAGGRGAPTASVYIRFEGLPQRAAAPRPADAPHAFHPGLHEDSRAPPAALA